MPLVQFLALKAHHDSQADAARALCWHRRRTRGTEQELSSTIEQIGGDTTAGIDPGVFLDARS